MRRTNDERHFGVRNGHNLSPSVKVRCGCGRRLGRVPHWYLANGWASVLDTGGSCSHRYDKTTGMHFFGCHPKKCGRRYELRVSALVELCLEAQLRSQDARLQNPVSRDWVPKPRS